MTIKSMTGFSRAEGALAGVTWHWEVRSVNGRGLDVRLRLPAGSEQLEPKAREAVGRSVVRGSITASLSSERRNGTQEIRLNERALVQVMKAADRIRDLSDAAPASDTSCSPDSPPKITPTRSFFAIALL